MQSVTGVGIKSMKLWAEGEASDLGEVRMIGCGQVEDAV